MPQRSRGRLSLILTAAALAAASLALAGGCGAGNEPPATTPEDADVAPVLLANTSLDPGRRSSTAGRLTDNSPPPLPLKVNPSRTESAPGLPVSAIDSHIVTWQNELFQVAKELNLLVVRGPCPHKLAGDEQTHLETVPSRETDGSKVMVRKNPTTYVVGLFMGESNRDHLRIVLNRVNLESKNDSNPQSKMAEVHFDLEKSQVRLLKYDLLPIVNLAEGVEIVENSAEEEEIVNSAESANLSGPTMCLYLS